MAQFYLKWDTYRQNIHNGLSAMQQDGEFVDMTLAADGHHVKVHRMVLSLVSPYIKELLASAQCQHPVIFLNKISYSTLSAILEYIYTGEVCVAKEDLSELIYAGKELRIRGLEEMTVEDSQRNDMSEAELNLSNDERVSQPRWPSETKNGKKQKKSKKEEYHQKDISYMDYGNVSDNSDHNTSDVAIFGNQDDTVISLDIERNKNIKELNASVQYTTSNQGQVQLILNRFMYNLRHSRRTAAGGRQWRWRCIEYQRSRCAAGVVTGGDVVLKRFSAHNHSFHDEKILKKVQYKAVYSAILEAEELTKNSKKERSKNPSTSTKDINDADAD